MRINQKYINETVKRCVRQYIKEAMSEQFSFERLKQIPTFKGRLDYCQQTCGFRVGTGSSRTCFQLDDNRILKLALNQKGIAQNEVESRRDPNLDSLGLRPQIFDESDRENNWFIVCEYVLPARVKDFKQTVGLTWKDFKNFVYNCYAEKSGKDPVIEWDYFYEMMEDNDKLWSIHDYMENYSVPVGDLLRLCNYGLSKNNGIVILDTGLDDYVWNNFYKR